MNDRIKICAKTGLIRFGKNITFHKINMESLSAITKNGDKGIYFVVYMKTLGEDVFLHYTVLNNALTDRNLLEEQLNIK